MPTDTLIKSLTRPEVYVVQNDERHWIPDPATLQSQWSWAQVNTVPPTAVDAIPLGDPIPSVLSGQKWPDGALLITPTAPQVYVMQGGQRRWIPDPPTFVESGYPWDAVDPCLPTL